MTGFIYHEDFLKHDTGSEHPENPERLKTLYEKMFESDLITNKKVDLIKPDFSYSLNYISAVHMPGYVEDLRTHCENNQTYFHNKENAITPSTFETSVKSAFSGLYASDLLMNGSNKNIFIASRPPGHHADKNRAYGFCYFNNIAITAEYLLRSGCYERIMIVDIDVHHGNGTQNIFYEENKVFYFSIHEHPTFLFPGTGRFFDNGKGRGLNYTANSPMRPESCDDDYFRELLDRLYPAVCEYKPDILLVSAGYDAHKDDIIGDISLTVNGFRKIFYALKYIAEEFCEGRMITFLEGGYEPSVLSECVINTLDVLSDGYTPGIFDSLATPDMFGLF